MALKHSDKLPSPSSSDEEEGTTSEAEEEDEETSDEEQEQSQTPLSPKTPQIEKPEISSPLTTAAETKESSESDGSESETDSSSDVPVIKPLETKPMVDDAKKQNSATKPSASSAKPKAKRPAESDSEPVQKESKRSKKEPENGREEKKNDSEDGEEKGKKLLFQRIWTEQDEIAVLKGMIEFKSERGTDPAADVNAFYEFVKNSLHMDFGIARLKDKMWRLKRKYKNNVKRGKSKGFSKAHEQEAYNLSKKIWVVDDEVVKAEFPAQSNGKAKKSQHVAAVKATTEASNKEILIKHGILLNKRNGVGSIEEEVLSHGWDLIAGEKKASLEKRWMKLRIAEMELFLQRNELVSEQVKQMLEIYKSGKESANFPAPKPYYR